MAIVLDGPVGEARGFARKEEAGVVLLSFSKVEVHVVGEGHREAVGLLRAQGPHARQGENE